MLQGATLCVLLSLTGITQHTLESTFLSLVSGGGHGWELWAEATPASLVGAAPAAGGCALDDGCAATDERLIVGAAHRYWAEPAAPGQRAALRQSGAFLIDNHCQ